MEQFLNQIYKTFAPDEYTVRRIYDAGTVYLFIISERDNDGEAMDPWYTIDKRTGKIKGFVVHENLNLFRSATRGKPVYTAK